MGLGRRDNEIVAAEQEGIAKGVITQGVTKAAWQKAGQESVDTSRLIPPLPEARVVEAAAEPDPEQPAVAIGGQVIPTGH